MKQTSSRGLPLLGHLYLFAFLTLAFSLISLLAEYNHYLDLLSHFKLHYLLASLFFVAFYYYFRKLYLVATFLLVSLLNSYFVISWYLPSEAKSQDYTSSVKIMSVNLLSSNRKHQQLLEVVKAHSPDIIVLQEVNLRWHEQLKPLQKNYPYFKSIPREDNFGIAVYSKHTLSSLTIPNWGNTLLPSLKFDVTVEQRTMQVLATHPLPPINAHYYSLRNKQIIAMLDDIKTSSQPTIVVGDLNTTMWSGIYQRFAEIDLVNARQGFGLHNTWPASFAFLGIPIDHILVSSQFKVKSFTSGPDIGSDHLPILAEIYL